MTPKLKDAIERTARTFVQTTAGAMLALLLVTDNAGWDDVPKAALASAFAGFLAFLGALAGPLAPKKSTPVE